MLQSLVLRAECTELRQIWEERTPIMGAPTLFQIWNILICFSSVQFRDFQSVSKPNASKATEIQNRGHIVHFLIACKDYCRDQRSVWLNFCKTSDTITDTKSSVHNEGMNGGDDESGDSEDELPFVRGGEREGDSI